MGKIISEKNGVAFVSLSLLLALLVMGTWVFVVPIFFSKFSTIEITNFLIFVFGCIGMALGILGFRYIKKTGISWSKAILSAVSLLANGIVIFFASFVLFSGAPEVKGVVQSIGNNRIEIYVDEGYKDEYNMEGSRLSSFNGASSTASKDATFLVGISNQTTFYEQNGKWMWQKKVVSRQRLQEGQHIQIKYNGWRFLDGSIVEAGEIIILDE